MQLEGELKQSVAVVNTSQSTESQEPTSPSFTDQTSVELDFLDEFFCHSPLPPPTPVVRSTSPESSPTPVVPAPSSALEVPDPGPRSVPEVDSKMFECIQKAVHASMAAIVTSLKTTTMPPQLKGEIWSLRVAVEDTGREISLFREVISKQVKKTVTVIKTLNQTLMKQLSVQETFNENTSKILKEITDRENK